jgi:hypothetical protein
MVYALIDCAQDDEVERTSVPKSLWIVLIILVAYFGPISWLVVSKIARPRGGTGHPPPSRRGPARRTGGGAPDDDPDFLRRLAEEARRRRGRGAKDGEDKS